MDNFINEDRKLISDVFAGIADRFELMAGENMGKEDIIKELAACAKNIERLRFNLAHISDVDQAPDTNNIQGLIAVKRTLLQTASEIRESIKDMSWVEDIDAFKKSQTEVIDQIDKVLNDPNAGDDQKAQAEQLKAVIGNLIPKDDTPEYALRKQRNDHILTGIVSAINVSLVDTAKL